MTLLLGGIAALALASIVVGILSARRMIRQGEVTTGTVTELEPVPSAGYVVHVRYEVDGRPHVHTAGSTGKYRVGEPVRIRYHREDPRQAVIDVRGHVWFGVIVATSLAVLFGIAAIVFLVLGHTRIL